MTDDTQRQALIRDIGRRLQLGSLDEVRVLDRLLVRLELGRERYGMLDLSKPRARSWRAELGDELLDAVVYDTIEQVREEDLERAPLRAAALAELHAPSPLCGGGIPNTVTLAADQRAFASSAVEFTDEELKRWTKP